MALLQQHDARWDILIEPAARRRAAIEAWGHSELGAQSGRKNQLAAVFVCLSVLYCNCCYREKLSDWLLWCAVFCWQGNSRNHQVDCHFCDGFERFVAIDCMTSIWSCELWISVSVSCDRDCRHVSMVAVCTAVSTTASCFHCCQFCNQLKTLGSSCGVASLLVIWPCKQMLCSSAVWFHGRYVMTSHCRTRILFCG